MSRFLKILSLWIQASSLTSNPFFLVLNWDLRSPRLVDLGRPRRSIRCAIPVLDRLWCGYGNRVYVVDPRTARIQVSP